MASACVTVGKGAQGGRGSGGTLTRAPRARRRPMQPRSWAASSHGSGRSTLLPLGLWGGRGRRPRGPGRALSPRRAVGPRPTWGACRTLQWVLPGQRVDTKQGTSWHCQTANGRGHHANPVGTADYSSMVGTITPAQSSLEHQPMGHHHSCQHGGPHQIYSVGTADHQSSPTGHHHSWR